MRTAVRRLGLLLSIGLLPSAGAAQAPAPQSKSLDPAALAIMGRLAEQLRRLPSLQIEAQIEYDALQRDGQTIEFGSARTISLRRPDHIRVEATDRSGAERALFYDGKQVAVWDQANAVYATSPETGDVDDVLRYIEGPLGIPIPLGDLLASDFGKVIDEDLVFAAIVRPETIDGVLCDHLALRNADRGIQLWVERGATPLLRRISITWEQAPGRPQFRARITKWELSPPLPDALFSFVPPEGAERIQFHRLAAAPAIPGGGR